MSETQVAGIAGCIFFGLVCYLLSFYQGPPSPGRYKFQDYMLLGVLVFTGLMVSIALLPSSWF